jgi:hypothetical protein
MSCKSGSFRARKIKTENRGVLGSIPSEHLQLPFWRKQQRETRQYARHATLGGGERRVSPLPWRWEESASRVSFVARIERAHTFATHYAWMLRCRR